MNPFSSPPPSDQELDRLLGSRLKRTSPEFEMRWRELRRTFSEPTSTDLFRLPRWLLWPGLAAMVGAVTIAVILRHSSPAPALPPVAQYEELFALDAALRPATALLDDESRDVVLHLSAQSKL